MEAMKRIYLKRKTPRVEAWLADLRPHLETRGSQSELARFLADSNDPYIIRRWVTTFYTWYHKRAKPGAEEILAINDWLQSRNH